METQFMASAGSGVGPRRAKSGKRSWWPQKMREIKDKHGMDAMRGKRERGRVVARERVSQGGLCVVCVLMCCSLRQGSCNFVFARTRARQRGQSVGDFRTWSSARSRGCQEVSI
jgi:hypothetical protein